MNNDGPRKAAIQYGPRTTRMTSCVGLHHDEGFPCPYALAEFDAQRTKRYSGHRSLFDHPAKKQDAKLPPASALHLSSRRSR